jgi:VanZ family protein
MSSRTYAVLWTVLIFILLCIPSSGFSKGNLVIIPHADKVVHFFLFCLFSFFWKKTLKQEKIPLLSLWIFSAGTLYGILLEFLQQLPFIQREFDMYDMLANSIGAATVFVFSFLKIHQR